MVANLKKAKPGSKRKASLTKVVTGSVFKDNKTWVVQHGQLKRGQGNPGKTEHLFRVVGEKLPFDSLSERSEYISRSKATALKAVYVAHDSMGCPRYIGRGNIFGRLEARKKGAAT